MDKTRAHGHDTTRNTNPLCNQSLNIATGTNIVGTTAINVANITTIGV
ncbi:hypothetical protein SDC9_77189 [bioreactor metagenome]|uniref:Uncharacterized protein n=1 Tax=bioreactor metagenome TaxID=1076179 RepID=A0A644YQQ2_9ZZZZ